MKENTKTFEEILLENVRQGKEYVKQGKLSQDDFKTIKSIDPTNNGKYVGWMSKIWINEAPDIDVLRNSIEEFDTLLKRHKTRTKDVNHFKSLDELVAEITNINNTGDNLSLKDLENDYETEIDTKKLLICIPHTHEASRKLGLTRFSFRVCKDAKGEENGKDSAWCTTYSSPDHFNSYYHQHNVTFFYIRVKGKKMIKKLQAAFPNKWEQMVVTALTLLDNGSIEGYDGTDSRMSKEEIKKFNKIIKIK
jgi:hypothetical protein